MILHSGRPFLWVRTEEVCIGACFRRKTSFVCSAGWIPDKQLLTQGELRAGACSVSDRLLVLHFRLWMCVSLFLVHGAIPHDFSVKTIRKRWVYFLTLSILAKNSSRLSYTELPFTTVVRPNISFKLCFVINWVYQGSLIYSDEIWSMAASPYSSWIVNRWYILFPIYRKSTYYLY